MCDGIDCLSHGLKAEDRCSGHRQKAAGCLQCAMFPEINPGADLQKAGDIPDVHHRDRKVRWGFERKFCREREEEGWVSKNICSESYDD